MVSGTYAPSFPTTTASISFVRRPLETFLTGLTVTTGVSVLVFPLNPRTIFFRRSSGFIGLLRDALSAQSSYLRTLKKGNAHTTSAIAKATNIELQKQDELKIEPNIEAQNLRKVLGSVADLQGKIYVDISFAKRKVAYGYLDAAAIDQLSKLLRRAMILMMGMGEIASIFERAAEWHGSSIDDKANVIGEGIPSEAIKQTEQSHGTKIIESLHVPFQEMTTLLHDGLDHVSLNLKLTKSNESKPSRSTDFGDRDLEPNVALLSPGLPGFTAQVTQDVDNIHKRRKATLTSISSDMDMDISARGELDAQARLTIPLYPRLNSKDSYSYSM